MSDSQDDTHFHLVTVDENEAVARAMPYRINTKKIGMTVRDGINDCARLIRFNPRPPTVEEMHALGEDIIIHEAGEQAENAHE